MAHILESRITWTGLSLMFTLISFAKSREVTYLFVRGKFLLGDKVKGSYQGAIQPILFTYLGNKFKD